MRAFTSIAVSIRTAAIMKSIGAGLVARTLAEQVANAKGVSPVDVNAMPIFRGEVMTSNEFSATASEKDKPNPW